MVAAKPHATSEDQVAALGNIRRKPVQIDLLTGELVLTPPKRGSGDHIALKPVGIEKPCIAGMADHAGEGPPGKYCRDCKHYGEVAVRRPNGYTQEVGTVEMNRGGCVIFASRTGHASVVASKSIELCNSCKLFKEAKPGDPRCFIIGPAGIISRLHAFPPPGKLASWRPE